MATMTTRNSDSDDDGTTCAGRSLDHEPQPVPVDQDMNDVRVDPPETAYTIDTFARCLMCESKHKRTDMVECYVFVHIPKFYITQK